jgi:2',3'-cyclic-nucleotide 2'-phosphodiesterase/3'-nucleotidase
MFRSVLSFGEMALTTLSLLLALVAAPTAAPDRVTVTVLATTDSHGYLLPYDYFTRQPAPRGLAADATLIDEVRRETPNTLLVDCGDTIEGSPLVSVYESEARAGKAPAPEPMMAVMNEMGYDAMVVGNHEFNFGLESLSRARSDAHFPWLSANTLTGSALPPFAPYLLKTIGGVKIAVIGVTTPGIPQWEKPEHIRGLEWVPAEEGVRRALAALEPERPDVILAAVHGGLDRDPDTGAVRPNQAPGENPVLSIAQQFPQLAAIIYGHTHRRDPGRRVGGVLLVQPRNWGMDVARVDIALERAPGGHWRLTGATSQLLPVTPTTPPDPRVVEIARPYHEAAERELDRPVTESPVALSGALGRFEDTALVDAIQEVQLYYARAQVSFASLFRTQASVPRGPVTRRELAALYVYDNELYAVEGNGRMVREALENASRYFLTCPDPSCARGPLVDHTIPGYNFDVAQGVDYEIDLTQPVGKRIRDLRYHGAPLRDDQPLRIALNNYRAAGSGGYSMFRDAKILWQSNRPIRDLMADYCSSGRHLPEKPDDNWRLLPPRAVITLEREEAGAR